MPALRLTLQPGRLTVCRLPADAAIPAWATDNMSFFSITRTTEELSIVCPEILPPAGVKQEPGWLAFKVSGPLAFGLTGVLASVLDPLAAAGVSIFALSTFDTDYVLVKAAKVDAAIQALRTAGHTVDVD